jgi:hypothetical protein
MKSFLRDINYGIIIRIIGFLLMLEGLFMLTSIPFAWKHCDRLMALCSSAIFDIMANMEVPACGSLEGKSIVKSVISHIIIPTNVSLFIVSEVKNELKKHKSSCRTSIAEVHLWHIK